MTSKEIAPIDRLPADVREIVEATMKLLTMYMPRANSIEMMVGRNIKATLKIDGGPMTRDVLEDTMAHLAFYKKYYPKAGDPSPELDSPEKILAALAAIWENHRAQNVS